MRIALIGFGEVGQTLADDLRGHDLTAYDVAFADADSIASRGLLGRTARRASTPHDAVRDVELAISAVTAAQDVKAARSVAGGLANGALFLDLNSCSPAQKQASAAIIEAGGGRYVEAAVMAPISPKRIASPMLLGGPHAGEALAVLAPLGFAGATNYSPVIGKAAATKLCRSVMIKGIEALITESMLAARVHGVEAEVLASLSDLLPIGDWEKLARYMIVRSVEHGGRRAEEMAEAAVTVRDAGVEPLMSEATVKRQAWAADHKAALATQSLGGLLDAILEARR